MLQPRRDNGHHRRTKTPRDKHFRQTWPLCESIESRTYLSVSFAAPNITSVNGAHSPIITAQFHGGDKPVDLAVATPTAVQILNGVGDGTFTVGTSIAFPMNPAAQTPYLVGSFIGSNADIVLLAQDPNTLNGVITFEAGNGDGTFTAGATSTITDAGNGFQPISGAMGDFNGDHKMDLAIVGKPTVGNQLVLAILTGNGDGTFTETQDYIIAASNAAASISDEPLLTDVPNEIILDDASGGNLDVFTGSGDGTFTQLPPTALSASLIALGNFTSSGNADIVAASGNTVTLLEGQGGGVFQTSPQGTLSFSGPVNALDTVDYDLDGHLDIVTNQGILLGKGDGTFLTSPFALPAPINGGGGFSGTIAAADFNGDGKIDFVGFSAAGNSLVSAVNTAIAPNTITFTSSANPANPGTDIQITASISASFAAIPSGTIEFFDGATDVGGATLVNGSASHDFGTGLSAGTHSITVHYSGDANFMPTTSPAFSQVILAPTVTTVDTSSNPSAPGNVVTFTASVTGNDNSGDVPSGNVQFFDGATPLGTAPIEADGTAALDVAALATMDHTITAMYAGDGHFQPSTSAMFDQKIGQPSLVPSIIATTLPSGIVAGTAVHGTVTVKLTNTTSTPISANSVAIFAEKNGSFAHAVLVSQPPVGRGVVVKPGQSKIIKYSIRQLPPNLANGPYKLIAQTRDSASEIETGSTGVSVTVAAAFIALSEKVVSVNLAPAVVGGAPTHAVAKVLITNGGNIFSKGAVTISLSASTNKNSPNTAITAPIKKLNLKPNGGSTLISIPLKSLPAVANGNYFVVAQVTDPHGSKTVASSANTFNIAAPFITLAATFAPLLAHVLKTGATLTLTNTGNSNDVSSLTETFGFSTDSAGTNAIGQSITLHSPKVHVKANGKIKLTVNGWKTIAASLTTGNYFLTVTIADDAGNHTHAVSATAVIVP